MVDHFPVSGDAGGAERNENQRSCSLCLFEVLVQ
jgi:hypothetical protein